jgi:phospholipase/lecithinase/hemolysin
MAALTKTRRDLRIIWGDLFCALNDVAANPPQYGFTKTSVAALNDPNLVDTTFIGPGAD